MKFTKMHGIGNDYVYVNGFEQTVADPESVARKVSDRHYGIGSDGLILILPSDKADVRMRMYNADGSRGEMCGNGIRCVAKYAFEHGIVAKTELAIDTDAGVKTLALDVRDGRVVGVTVDMGEPILDGAAIPVRAEGRVVEAPLVVDGVTHRITCVSMGNPHCVLFVDDTARAPVHTLGPRIESDPFFPNKVNVEFIEL